jgi:hypothetical protein
MLKDTEMCYFARDRVKRNYRVEQLNEFLNVLGYVFVASTILLVAKYGYIASILP